MERENLAPVGATVKRTEAYLQRRRMQRGGGWSDHQRAQFREWEAAERAERWTVAAHLPPQSEHNSALGWAYQLESGSRVCYSTPWDWEADPVRVPA